MPIELTSPAIQPGGFLPERYTGDGADLRHHCSGLRRLAGLKAMR